MTRGHLEKSNVVQAHVPVHPLNALFIAATAIEPQPRKALPESPPPMPSDNGVVGINDLGVSFRCWRGPLVVRRPRKAGNLTSARDGKLGMHQLLHHLAPDRRHQDLRFRTSLIAAFSSASEVKCQTKFSIAETLREHAGHQRQ